MALFLTLAHPASSLLPLLGVDGLGSDGWSASASRVADAMT